MTKRPAYDLTVIIPFGGIGLFCLWSIYWNCIIFNLPINVLGIAVGLIGIVSLGSVTYYALGVRKLRKDFVWETLKNG